MAVIEWDDAKAWIHSAKVTDTQLDEDLVAGVEVVYLARMSSVYDTSDWITVATTPSLVKKIVAMAYVAHLYNRYYSEDEGLSAYAAFLLSQIEILMSGLSDSSIKLPEDESGQLPPNSSPSFYPTDASSAMEPTAEDPSLGGPAFSMGHLW